MSAILPRTPVYTLSFLLAACSLLYELLIATTVTFLTGDTLVTYSVVIGLFLTGLGVGSYLSRRFENNSLQRLIQIELILSVLGGFSVILLHTALIATPYFTLAWVLLTFFVAVLSGFEVPLLTYLLHNDTEDSKSFFATVLSFDYLGGLLASLLFPFLLIPYIGTVATGLLIGLGNLCCALYLLRATRFSLLEILTGTLAVLLLVALGFSTRIYNTLEGYLYRDRIVYSKQSPYQRLTLTQADRNVSLFLDGKTQFSSRDEYRYHEFMVYGLLSHVPSTQDNLRVAILGGGDGLLASRLRDFDARIEQVTLVDLDPAVVELGRSNRLLRELNEDVFAWPKLEVITADAFATLPGLADLDAVFIDFPDPQDLPTARLYSREFYTTLRNSLTPQGIFLTQATSPWSVPEAFWSIRKTIATRFEFVEEYQVTVPSFGTEWGFVLASNNELKPNPLDTTDTRYFESIDRHRLAKDHSLEPTKQIQVNTLDNLILTTYYRRYK